MRTRNKYGDELLGNWKFSAVHRVKRVAGRLTFLPAVLIPFIRLRLSVNKKIYRRHSGALMLF